MTLASQESVSESRGRPVTHAEDAALLQRSAGGDEVAFAKLYDRYRRQVFRLAYSL